jgi:hypothetical protein
LNNHPAERTPGHREVDPCRSPFGEHQLEENLGRIQRRAEARTIDDLEFERRTFAEEREALQRSSSGELGEPFDVSGPPGELVERMLERIR